MKKILIALLSVLNTEVCWTRFISEFWSEPRPPINIYMDNHPPFFHGVTSGDPLPDSIILWTRATPRSQVEVDNGVEITWRIWESANSTEEVPVLQGNATASPERDWTVKVEASPLPYPNTTYYYRFYTKSSAESSRIGRTRTAPDFSEQGGILTFAITSCSQHQMYQNTFAHLAYNVSIGGEIPLHLRSWKNDKIQQVEAINAMLDLGDYVYDTNEKTTYARTWTGTCEDERARDPENREETLDPAFAPFPDSRQNCSWPVHSEEEWKWRHSMNHMDPDMRAALAAHPWIHLIDSHDVGNSDSVVASNPGLKVFEWWTPVRWELFNDSNSGVLKFRLHRLFRFGKLADVVILDTRAIGYGNGEDSYLGEDQRAFVRNTVLGEGNATQGWRVFMTGKAFVAWNVNNWAYSTSIILFTIMLCISPFIGCCVYLKKKRNKEFLQSSLSKGEMIENARSPNLSMMVKLEKAKRTCILCCGSKVCIGFGALTIVALTIVWISLLVYGNFRITKQTETNILNPFATTRNWDGVGVVDRAEFMKDLEDSGYYEDNIFVSGDMHMLTACEVLQSMPGHRIIDESQFTSERNLPDYENIEVDRVGVEWLPSSTSSRNIDDFMQASIPFPWLINAISNLVRDVILSSNPQMKHFDTIQHGIGYLHITSEEARMEFYRNDVFFPFREAFKTWSANVERGTNRFSEMFNRLIVALSSGFTIQVQRAAPRMAWFTSKVIGAAIILILILFGLILFVSTSSWAQEHITFLSSVAQLRSVFADFENPRQHLEESSYIFDQLWPALSHSFSRSSKNSLYKDVINMQVNYTSRTGEEVMLGVWKLLVGNEEACTEGYESLSIIYSHGNAENRATAAFKYNKLAEEIVYLGRCGTIYTYDYRGFADSSGTASETNFIEDATSLFQRLDLRPSRTVIIGHSLGTFASLNLALQLERKGTPAAALILEAPLTRAADVCAFWMGGNFFPSMTRHFRDICESYARVGLGSIEIIKSYMNTFPIYIFHGLRDWTVPHELGVQLQEACPPMVNTNTQQHSCQLHSFPTAGHVDIFQDESKRDEKCFPSNVIIRHILNKVPNMET